MAASVSIYEANDMALVKITTADGKEITVDLGDNAGIVSSQRC
jgi:hypothetical protein